MWIFILLAGLRYRIGSDTIIYEYAFNDVPVISELTLHYLIDVSRFEYGFTIMMSLTKTLFKQFWVLLFIQSLITNYCVFIFFKQNTRAPYVALILYFFVLYYFINCEAARQGVAVGIFLYSWKYFVNNNWLKYFTAVIIASLFHITAILFIILPFFKILKFWYKIKPSPFMYIILVLVLFSSVLIGFHLSNYILALELSGVIGEKSNSYFNTKEFGSLSPTTIFAYLFSYILMPMFFLSKRNVRESTYGSTMIPMIFLSCIVCLCGGIPMTYRISYYLLPFFFVALTDSLFRKQIHSCSESVKMVYKNKPNVILIMMVIIYLVYKSQMYFTEESPGGYYKYYMRLYPYNSVIDKGIDQHREGLYRK